MPTPRSTDEHAAPLRPRFARDLPSPVPPHPADVLLSAARASAFRQVLARRTGRLAVVVEECHDPHNATAVLRTCDIFGVHRVHVVAGRTGYKVNRQVSQGAHRYLDLHLHARIAEAYAELKADGFTIHASDLGPGAVAGPQELRQRLADAPLALVFGSEGFGLSPEAVAGADGRFLIPMAGFSQSLNLSVSVAVSVYALRAEALSADAPGDLAPAVQQAWYDRWVRADRGEAAEILVAAQERGRRGEDLDVYRALPG